MSNLDIVYYPYPTTLLDEYGYPTQEALDYIKNWSLIYGGEVPKMGKFFTTNQFDDLIKYIQSIWYYDDAIKYEDGLLEIHTLGWSGNESVIAELKNTILWLTKYKATRTGGHYYFRIDTQSDYDYDVVKIPSIFKY